MFVPVPAWRCYTFFVWPAGRTVDTVTFHPAMLVDGHVQRKCPSVIGQKFYYSKWVTVLLGPQGIDRSPYRAHSRDAGPALHQYVFSSRAQPLLLNDGSLHLPSQRTSVRTEISVYCSFQHVRKNFEPHPQFFRDSKVWFKGHGLYQLSSVRMRSSETWRELQKILALIRGRVTVLRGQRSSTLSVDIRYVMIPR